MKNTSKLGEDRQIRVFISSTFRDMQAERDYLVKFIFPQLRKLCESRGVTWGEVDLRWGVTDEQAAEGKVLPICLEEIKRCRPYFIGLLGERYGWIPDAIPADVIEREPWLKDHLHGKKSVTELEILHGVLREEKMHGHAFFHFRDPAFINTVPPDKRLDFVTEDASSAEKLRHLKEAIRHAQVEQVCVLRENYPTPEALGELVLTDLTKVINDTWPEGSQPDPLDREAMDHEAYAKSRVRVYIGRQEYFDRLDAHAAANDTRPLVILGESGSGKSALLANWVARYRQAHPDALVLQHYIGATPYSADWAAMLRRLMGEFKRRLGVQQDIPNQPDALRSAFPNWLYMAAAKGRVVLVLDALNQLEDHDGAPDLVWLPPVMPENVRLIVSTLPGRSLDEIQKRNWRTLKVELLSADERRKLITEYLAQHAKSLNAARVERIAAAPQSANPLYLRVLLDELRLVRTHEELEERIGDYLQAQSPYALYEKVITRWEQDYEGDTDLVVDTLSLLWAARRGLTETELLQALGKNGDPLPRAKWSPLFLAMSDALISRGGLLTFAHEFLRTAVAKQFLGRPEEQHVAHLQLGAYFLASLKSGSTRRALDEVLWQICGSCQWDLLYSILTNHDMFVELWTNDQYEVRRCWSVLEDGSAYRLVEASKELIEMAEAGAYAKFLVDWSDLLDAMGHPAESLATRRLLLQRFREAGNTQGLKVALNRVAGILWRQGALDEATALHTEQEAISRATGDTESLVSCLNGQGLIHQTRGNIREALALFQQATELARQRGDRLLLQSCLGNQGIAFRILGDMPRAEALFAEQGLICREKGDRDGLQLSLRHQGVVRAMLGYPDEALELLRRAAEICRELGNDAELAESLGDEAQVLISKGDLAGAMRASEERAALARSLGDRSGQAHALGTQGQVLRIKGRLAEALGLFREAEAFSREAGDGHHLQALLGDQGVLMEELGDAEAALGLYQEQERMCRQSSFADGLQCSLGNQGIIYLKIGRATDAMRVLKQQESICRETGNQDGLQRSLGNQSNVLRQLGQYSEALGLQREKQRISAAIGTTDGVIYALASQAALLAQDLRDLDAALPLVEEAYRLATRHGLIALAEQIDPLLKAVRAASRSH